MTQNIPQNKQKREMGSEATNVHRISLTHDQQNNNSFGGTV